MNKINGIKIIKENKFEKIKREIDCCSFKISFQIEFISQIDKEVTFMFSLLFEYEYIEILFDNIG